MKKLKRILLVLIVLAAIAVIYYYPKLRRVNHAMHLFDDDEIVNNLRTIGDWWAYHSIQASTNAQGLPERSGGIVADEFMVNESWIAVDEYLKKTYTNGLLVMQDDTIIHEQYFDGHSEEQTQIVWSVSKSFLSALFGIAISEGDIKSIEEKVEDYCPELIGSGYEGVRIKDVLQMSSGVRFNEDYADFFSDINRWGRDFSWGNSQDKFAATLTREKEPGTYHHYVSIDTHVLGMILVKATGRSIASYAQEKLWNPLGMEHDSYWIIDDFGMEAALGGLNTTIRNCARLGSLFLNKGKWNGEQIVPEAWVTASTTPDAPHLIPGARESSAHSLGYGYQWWVPEGDDGEFLAIGVYNQFIYINPKTRTVIVKHSANPGFAQGEFLAGTDVFLELCRKIASLNYGSVEEESVSNPL
ncbi:MAG: serine hydrolase [Cyclobacteriaceae bacterium]